MANGINTISLGLRPFFITGGNSKLFIDGKFCAFAVNTDISIRMAHFAPKLLGAYESETLEPLAYDIGGVFAVVRYTDETANVKSNFVTNKRPSGMSPLMGNQINNFFNDPEKKILLDHIRNGRYFDLKLYQKYGDVTDNPYITIKKCRIIGMDSNLNKRGLYIEVFSFMGCYNIWEENTETDTANTSRVAGDYWQPVGDNGDV